MPEPIDTVLDELRAELAAARTASGPDTARRKRIVDAWIVRHPSRAVEFRELLGAPDAEPTGGEVTKGPGGAIELEDAPRSLGRFHLIRELGRGGMGIVFLARDEGLHRLVAVKILPRNMAANQEMLDRFQREAAAVTELEHPAIVPIFEIGEDSGVHYYAMGYVDGRSLKEFAAEQLERRDVETDDARTTGRRTGVTTWRPSIPRLGTARIRGLYSITPESLGRILDVIEQVARALEHAHQNDILHRDVKPSNIMVDREGMAHLLDFGLAKFLDGDTQTQSGRMLGTVPYMAPEQLSSKHGPVDHRADVYALGVTLYESITGVRPFDGESHEALMFQAIMKPPPSPCELVPELSRDVETVVLKCLEKNPDRRYGSCAALAEDLARIRAHKRIEAAPVGRAGRLVRWAERNRAFAGVAAAVLLLVLAIPVLEVWGVVSARRARARAAATELERADDARSRHAALRARLGEIALELAALRNEVEPHEEASSPAKTRLLALRHERRSIRAELPRLELEATFAWDRASELGADAASELALFLRELYDDAWRRLDGERARVFADRMAARGFDRPPVPTGRVTLRSFPSGASVRVLAQVFGHGRVEEEPALEATTPIEGAVLPCGSYVAEIRAPGRIAVRYPFLVEPGEHWGDPGWHGGVMGGRPWKVELSAAGAWNDERWVLIPRGPYQATIDREALGGSPDLEWRWLDDFVIARLEAAFADYRPFFERPERQRAIEKSLRAQKARWFPRADRGWHAALVRRKVPDDRLVLDIRPECDSWPLTGLTPPDIEDFARWLGERDGIDYALPTSAEWEKAARGVDGRRYPWGDVFDPTFTACAHDGETVGWPDRRGHPIDRSPYGVIDLAGNVEEWCRDGAGLREAAGNNWVAGGSIGQSAPERFTAWPRMFFPYDGAENALRGFRLVRSAGKER